MTIDEKLQHFYNRGIRLITLTWNYENEIGYPNSNDPGVMASGLKSFGFQALEEMNRLGIIVDVSHLSDGGFWDVAKHTQKPFIASHSNARSITVHPRIAAAAFCTFQLHRYRRRSEYPCDTSQHTADKRPFTAHGSSPFLLRKSRRRV